MTMLCAIIFILEIDLNLPILLYNRVNKSYKIIKKKTVLLVKFDFYDI